MRRNMKADIVSQACLKETRSDEVVYSNLSFRITWKSPTISDTADESRLPCTCRGSSGSGIE